MQSVQRAFNWALKMGHIDRSPVRFLEKPPQGKRENPISADQFHQLLETAHPAFHDLLTVAWETGARPQELTRICANHIHGERIVFREREAKGKKRIRVIYLTGPAQAICERIANRFQDGPIFRNSKGHPWTPFAVNCAFRRAFKKTGIKAALVDLRHSFAQRLLTQGIDPLTVSVLMGHVDTAMLCRVYSHLQQDADHLKKALRRANSTEDESASGGEGSEARD
jgi:integrase